MALHSNTGTHLLLFIVVLYFPFYGTISILIYIYFSFLVINRLADYTEGCSPITGHVGYGGNGTSLTMQQQRDPESPQTEDDPGLSASGSSTPGTLTPGSITPGFLAPGIATEMQDISAGIDTLSVNSISTGHVHKVVLL